jgi:hypothetical protein
MVIDPHRLSDEFDLLSEVETGGCSGSNIHCNLW